jgi:hypothetical protein
MATLEYACTAWPYRLVSSAAWRRVLAALPVTNPDEQCGDRVQPPLYTRKVSGTLSPDSHDSPGGVNAGRENRKEPSWARW